MKKLFLVATGIILLADPARAQNAGDFSFEGGTVFTRAELVRALRRYDLSLDPPIEATTADDAAYFLREFLFGQGFPEAEVGYAITGRQVVFTITEGPRFELGQVDFLGSEVVTRERMRDILIAQVRQQTRSPIGRLRYVESAVQDGAERIRLALVQEGFLDAQVTATPAFEGMLVNISSAVESGRQYHIREVVLQGGGIPPDAEAAAAAFREKIYRPGDEYLARSRVQDVLRKEGFFEARVEEQTTFQGEDGSVRIVLNIQPGARYSLGKITVDGNRQTLALAIMRRLGLRPGVYNSSAVDAGVRRLWFSGAFSDVNIKEVPTKNETVDVQIEVKEGQAKQVSATVGYGEWNRAFAEGAYTDRNFLGTNKRFSLKAYVSQRSHGLGASLSDPWFLQTEIIATVSALYTRLEQPAYSATQYGGGVSMERRDNPGNQTGWRLGYQWKVVTDSTVDADDELDGAALNYTLGELSYQQTLDRRNDLLTPMKGYYLTAKADIASQFLLGEISYGRLSGQATWYLPLRPIIPERPFVPFVVLNSRAGLMLPFAGTEEIPIQERFFLGGPDTVRSFQLDGLGPKDADGYLEGGLAYLLGNAEIQWPVWKAFYLAAFVDVGNLSPTVEDFNWDETRIGVGLGGRVYTPLGAIRVDYGHNLIRKDGDPAGAWQFGFGFTF